MRLTIGIMLAVCAWAGLACGSGLPAHVEEEYSEAIEQADAEYDAEVATAEARYDKMIRIAEDRYQVAEATAEARHTDAARKVSMDYAERGRTMAIDSAKDDLDLDLSSARHNRIQRIERAEAHKVCTERFAEEYGREKFDAHAEAMEELARHEGVRQDKVRTPEEVAAFTAAQRRFADLDAPYRIAAVDFLNANPECID